MLKNIKKIYLKLVDILNQPYDLLSIREFKEAIVYGGTTLTILILYFFKPFGFAPYQGIDRLITILYFMLPGEVIAVLHLFVYQKYFLKKLTIKNTLIYMAIGLFLMSLWGYILNAVAYFNCEFTVYKIFMFIARYFWTGLFPISSIILIHYIYILRKRNNELLALNTKIKKNVSKSEVEKLITLYSNNQKEIFTITPNNLLYITSANNYVEIFYISENDIKHFLLRNTLQGIEKQISNFQKIKRCHKSFIINLELIDNVIINASGYKLKLKNCEEIIPISKTYKENIFEIINFINI